jgi:hypothetical protein
VKYSTSPASGAHQLVRTFDTNGLASALDRAAGGQRRRINARSWALDLRINHRGRRLGSQPLCPAGVMVFTCIGKFSSTSSGEPTSHRPHVLLNAVKTIV